MIYIILYIYVNVHTMYVTDGPRTTTPLACAMLSPISLKGGPFWSKYTTVK